MPGGFSIVGIFIDEKEGCFVAGGGKLASVVELPCVHIFLLGFMLCKSALFIENYIKQLYRLRRCLLFT